MQPGGGLRRVPLSELVESGPEAAWALRRRGPVIITGLSSGADDWSLEAIEEAFGNADLSNWVRIFEPLAPGECPSQSVMKRQIVDTKDMRFSPDFVEQLKSGAAAACDQYWSFSSPGQTFSQCIQKTTQFEKAEALLGLRPGGVEISAWVGANTHVEPLHYDDDDNLHLMLRGSKRWIIFPPSQTLTSLGFYSLWPLAWALLAKVALPKLPNGIGCDPASTAVDPNKSTLGRERCVFTLDAGEALYLPATWAHQVESTPASSDAPDPSEHIFSVNRFYPTPLSQNCGRWQVGWLIARLRLFHWLADTVADGGAQKVWAMLGLLLCGMMTAMVWIGLKYGNVGLETV